MMIPADKCKTRPYDILYLFTDAKPCPGNFYINSTFPIQKGEMVQINYTVTGEQRFYDFWSETAPARGYNVSN